MIVLGAMVLGAYTLGAYVEPAPFKVVPPSVEVDMLG